MHTLFQNLKERNYSKNIEKASKLTSIHGSAIFQVKDKCTSLVGSRNKLDHSEKKYGLSI
jgi:hypothetical protein